MLRRALSADFCSGTDSGDPVRRQEVVFALLATAEPFGIPSGQRSPHYRRKARQKTVASRSTFIDTGSLAYYFSAVPFRDKIWCAHPAQWGDPHTSGKHTRPFRRKKCLYTSIVAKIAINFLKNGADISKMKKCRTFVRYARVKLAALSPTPASRSRAEGGIQPSTVHTRGFLKKATLRPAMWKIQASLSRQRRKPQPPEKPSARYRPLPTFCLSSFCALFAAATGRLCRPVAMLLLMCFAARQADG